jgi:DNA-binding response OmpR family regulator
MDETGTNAQPSIFLIEDSDDCVRMLNFLFTRQGYTLLHAKDGIEAQTMIDTINRPSVVILDMMLPYADGLQLLASIRNNLSWSNVPVLMLTSDETTRTVVKAFELGANDFVVKPYKPMELVVRVNRLAAA